MAFKLMAFSSANYLSVSFHSPIVASSNNKIPIHANSNFTNLSSLTPTATNSQKLTTAQDTSLLSVVTPQQSLLSVDKKHFIKQDDNNIDVHEHEQKLKVFKQVLRKVGEDSIEGLKIIDAIQRLGIEYKFVQEIDEILQGQYLMFSASGNYSYDLHEVALRFRLLRQQGYSVPSDVVISKFKENYEEIMLKKHTSQGIIKGLMSLYEASQLSIKGEEALEEAGDICFKFLTSSMANLDPHEARVVENTLANPHYKSLSKFMAKNYFGNFSYGEANGWKNALQDVAKIEFNLVQSLYQDELVQISKWWKDEEFTKDLKFAREHIANKCHFWAMACLTDPSLSKERIQLTKVISFIYLMDDIFDVCGTPDELIHFTESVNRWGISAAAAKAMPECMTMFLKALFGITKEISQDIYRMQGWNPHISLQNTWGVLCTAFMEEAKWFWSGQVPKTDEYLENGMVSSGVNVVLVHILMMVGITESTTAHVVESNYFMPPVISSTAAILRLWDDLGSAKDEKQEGHDGSFVVCYMKEHKGSSVEEAREKIRDMISEAWKSLNKECLSPNPFPPTFINASLNLARMVPLMYNYDENQSLPILEQVIKSVLYERVTI